MEELLARVQRSFPPLMTPTAFPGQHSSRPAGESASTARSVLSCRHCFSEMAPVCAVVGGILAQEIVKVKGTLVGGRGPCLPWRGLWAGRMGA